MPNIVYLFLLSCLSVLLIVCLKNVKNHTAPGPSENFVNFYSEQIVFLYHFEIYTNLSRIIHEKDSKKVSFRATVKS